MWDKLKKRVEGFFRATGTFVETLFNTPGTFADAWENATKKANNRYNQIVNPGILRQTARDMSREGARLRDEVEHNIADAVSTAQEIGDRVSRGADKIKKNVKRKFFGMSKKGNHAKAELQRRAKNATKGKTR